MKFTINGLFLGKILVFVKKSSCQKGFSVKLIFGFNLIYFLFIERFLVVGPFWLLDRFFEVVNGY